jgi:hypothetical protein
MGSANHAINITGSLIVGTTADLDANTREQQQDEIALKTVSTFEENDWIMISDTLAPEIGDAIHQEINRIRSLDTETKKINLWYPLVNAYTTAESAKITKLNPVESVVVMGGGRITNTGTASTSGTTGGRVSGWSTPSAVQSSAWTYQTVGTPASFPRTPLAF